MFNSYSTAPELLLISSCTPLDEPEPPDDMKLPILDMTPLTQRFFVPQLADKPQNPIMDTLKLEKERELSKLSNLPMELGLLAMDPVVASPPAINKYNLWTDALTRNLGLRNKYFSWDRLRPSHPTKASSTGFLSEQDNLVFAAARYNVNLRLRDPAVQMVYVSQSNALNALKMTLLGASSVYHTWNPVLERFTQTGEENERIGYILIDGKDEVVSTRSAREGPTVHAYAHALATIIAYLRNILARGPPVNDPLSGQDTLSAIWMHYAIYEETLVALAEFYGREETKSPQEYPVFEPSAVVLLTAIYRHLERHIERQSPRTIIAIFAFILTHVSHEYLQQVSRSVGYGTDSVEKACRVTRKAVVRQDGLDEEEEVESRDDLFDTLEQLGDTFPDFFPRKLLDILPASQKSLVLLERAKPDHPMLSTTATQGTIRWFWTESLVEAAWNGQYPGESNMNSDVPIPPYSQASEPDQELAIFRVFDLEPGASTTSPALAKEQATTQSLQSFIDIFPASLPSLTLTLSHLTSLVMAPLVDHASALSTALLTLFLTPSQDTQDTLNFQAHLGLLRSYLLVTAPPFKDRLSAALFSGKEAGESDSDNMAHGLAIRSLRHRHSSKKVVDADAEDESAAAAKQPWAVGLAPSLLERETWPPVGSDLSFFLRTVIVDSIEDGAGARFGAEYDESVKPRVLGEAEYRLGFAIRDLPTGSGRNKWLNPLCIEALDFLYMDYKPPTALEVLITPDILSKYQRLFTFILRLMRVEHALTSLFRMTRAAATGQPLFPTLTTSRNALLHFRFVAQSFVSNLSAYIFDTAISGNFDPFIVRLSVHDKDITGSDGGKAASNFSDVFALAKSHSALLDDILSACLLRSNQRAVGEILRNALELILEYTVVVGQLYQGCLKEYEAAGSLDDISKKFFSRMATLTKVLKGLADKNGLAESTMLLPGSVSGAETPHRPTGGTDALYHLLIRLDFGNWWLTGRR
ncbi:hypothetical protein H0H92_007054 [Tricholoma furcatifolium]|nr:hypothetical protein H0H92_007054 [Tricholoma furcatifolium]